jgi:hypothetical protein
VDVDSMGGNGRQDGEHYKGHGQATDAHQGSLNEMFWEALRAAV